MTDYNADSEKLRIVFASSEAVPFSKTGGLADVATSLSRALVARGHQVSLFVPKHRFPAGRDLPPVHDAEIEFEVPVGSEMVKGSVSWSEFPDSGLRVFFIDQPDYFDRDGLYGTPDGDHPDNCARFVFFSRAVLEASRHLVLRPHVVHCNDWQTGLIPVLMDAEHRDDAGFRNTASVFTIHNLAYQGQFWHHDMQLTNLDWRYFNFQQLESHGNMNLMKAGITLADRVTTVSPTYAREIQTAEFGCGMESVLQHHALKVSGILNGIDTNEWSPATDPLLSDNYDVDSVSDGKPKCKRVLQDMFGLPQRSDVPLVGMVSRMSTQKGFDIIAEAAHAFLKHDLQLCILGTGDKSCEDMSARLAEQFPDKVAVKLAFSEELAHRIEAGSDVFLMPSRYEPCGLNQMYSLAYGTLPLVRATGGLADSVVDATPENIASGTATGFAFKDYNPTALAEAFGRMMELYGDQKTWQQLVKTGMQQDWSWNRSAAEYEAVYRMAMETCHV